MTLLFLYPIDAVTDGRKEKSIERLSVHPTIVNKERGIETGHNARHEANAFLKEISRKQINQRTGTGSSAAEKQPGIDISTSDQ
jgi:hypothetical protein